MSFARSPVDRSNIPLMIIQNRQPGQRGNRLNLSKEGNKMSIELKQNLDELKIKLEHLRSYL